MKPDVDFWLAVAWAVMLPIAFVTGLAYVLAFITFVSIYANVVGHWSSHRASQAAKETVELIVQDERIPTNDDPNPKRNP